MNQENQVADVSSGLANANAAGDKLNKYPGSLASALLAFHGSHPPLDTDHRDESNTYFCLRVVEEDLQHCG